MSNYNRLEQLKELHLERKLQTQQKVDKAIKSLIKNKASINFNSVAAESGLSKTTLYNNQDIRTRIENLRLQELNVPTPGQVKREMSDNNKDALIASLKRKIKKLEDENKQLREQLKINYADIYTHI